jgi:hypothetical protein
MRKPENIYVTLQLNKDDTSGELLLNIQFDQNAPNFSNDKNNTSWCPTIEELDFVSEAFSMLSKGKRQRQERTTDPDHREPTSTTREIPREADEKAILDRVLEKKRPNY